MTEAELAELEALCKVVAPGPWRVIGGRIIQTNHITRNIWFIPHSGNDVKFIANSRSSVPYLLAEVLRLRKALKEASESE